ncbi:XdhC family protein [Aquimarina sp. U1-2]|uniref:XdhC family protein n=1 Tax=Aquimarina sp. U1-2 TaxID=2823141 RepID=UPI001AECF072|nr:XdhC family protein [Aquimarina sp. U1-2]MBP2831236.1 XdhC family protein [Aquimarina sp. U1-2]
MRELDEIIHTAYVWNESFVLATIVKTEGSSYRKPGARMLIGQNGRAVGAISGGCIEKEVIRRSKEVFISGEPVLIEYDGRYRLGCNGTLYILIEPFDIPKDTAFWKCYFQAFKHRHPWKITSRFEGEVMGSVFQFDKEERFSADWQKSICKFELDKKSKEGVFTSSILPSRQLHIIGSESDAFKLAKISAEVGFQVTLIGHPQNPLPSKPQDPYSIINIAPEELHINIGVDEQTAVVLMTHSYSRDLSYLLQLFKLNDMPYLGLLGPKRRRDSLISEVIEHMEILPDWLDSSLRAPAGLDIGGELPGEIAVSILAEIQAILSSHSAAPLLYKKTNIHDKFFAAK